MEGGRKTKKKTGQPLKLGAGGWFKINDLHEGKKEEEGGEGEKEGCTLKHVSCRFSSVIATRTKQSENESLDEGPQPHTLKREKEKLLRELRAGEEEGGNQRKRKIYNRKGPFGLSQPF